MVTVVLQILDTPHPEAFFEPPEHRVTLVAQYGAIDPTVVTVVYACSTGITILSSRLEVQFLITVWHGTDTVLPRELFPRSRQ